MTKLLTLLVAAASLAGALAIAATCPVQADLSGLDHSIVADARL